MWNARSWRSIGLFAAIIVSIGIWRMLGPGRSGEPDLLSNCKVASTVSEGWGSFLANDYAWVDNHHVVRQTVDTNGPASFAAVVEDTDNGSQTPFSLPPGAALSSTDSYLLTSFSPDGAWALWQAPDYGKAMCSSFDASKTMTWNSSSQFIASGMRWLPEGDRWATIVGASTVAIYCPSSPVPQTIGITGLTLSSGHYIAAIAHDGCMLVADRSDSRFSAWEYNKQTPYVFHQYQMKIIGGKVTSITQLPDIAAAVPSIPDAQDGQAVVSPEADRILWTFRSYTRRPLDLARLFHMYDPPGSVLRMYVSDIHGGSLREIGALDEGTEYPVRNGPVWCPDGKHFSFVWTSKLYVEPV